MMDRRQWMKRAKRTELDERGHTDEIGQKGLDGWNWTEGAKRMELDGRMLIDAKQKVMDIGWNCDER
jgi:hypothetical protein